MLEKHIENAVNKAVKARDGMCIKLVSPTMNGLPDRLLLLPRGRVAFVELKQSGIKPRQLQLKRHEQLRSLGFKVYVIDDKMQIGGVLDEIQTT